MNDEVLYAIAEHDNICNYIHLPVQSGSSRILKAMNRGHNREEYIDLIKRIKKIIPNCGISHDMITGFPGETEEDHAETLSLMELVKYDFGYVFFYSERPNTFAARNLDDDVPLEIKKRRLSEIIEYQQRHSRENLSKYLGQTFQVLVEGKSKKSEDDLFGRTSQNNVVVFPKKNFRPGDFVDVKIQRATSATLIGIAI